MTEQRKIVYDVVMSACTHPTAEEVFLEAKRRKPNIAMGTVYRNLNLLAEAGDILHIKMLGGPDRFDKTVRPHDHMECIRCKSVFDVEIGDLTDHLESRSGQKVVSYELSLKGICSDCLEKESKNG